MRIRSIRPEFWSSEDVAAMDWHTRLVFIGLWSYVDDNGVGRDVEPLIVAALFPLDGTLPESSRRVTGALRHLSDRGQITRYRVNGKAYLFVNAWKTHQRIEKASAGRYPLPTSENAEIVEPSPTIPVALPEPSTPGEEEKGRRGEEEKTSAPARASAGYTEEFEEFWSHYPLKKDKADAFKAWRTALKKTTAEDLIKAVQAYPFRGDPKFIKHAATWLNKGSWEDEESNVLLLHADPDRRLTAEEVLNAIGVDMWSCPEPPPGFDADQEWEWRRDRQIEHIEERQRQARAKLNGGVTV